MTAPLGDDALDRLFRNGRSYNGYLDKPVSDEQLRAIWDLMKWGPTSANQMPARFVWVRSEAAKAQLGGLVSSNNQGKVLSAPVTAIIGMDLDFPDHLPRLFPHTDARSWFAGNAPLIEASAFRNSTLQGAYLILAARALGIDSGALSGFDNAGVDAAFFAGSNVRANFIVTLGYGDPASVFDRHPKPDFEDYSRIV